MNKTISTLVSFSLAAMISGIAYSADPMPAAAMPSSDAPMAKDGKTQPCKAIKDACEAAGFSKGGHKDGKGMHKDCMKPLMDGQTVAGVTVAPEDVQACKAKHSDKSKN